MKRYCVICGKELNINLIGNRIPDEFIYVPFVEKQGIDFEPKTIDEQKEYWECKDCAEEECS